MHEGDKASRAAPSRRGRRHGRALRVAVGVAACLAGVAGTATLGSWASATGSVVATGSPPVLGRFVRIGSAPRVPRSAALLGRVPGSQTVELDVALRPRDPAALARFVSAVSTPGSPEFRRYLEPGTFGAAFGATEATVRSTTTALERLGLHVGPVAGNRLIVKVTSTAAIAERAFATTLVRYRLGSGALVYANLSAPRVPAALAGRIQAIAGLSDLALSHPAGLSRPGPPTSARGRSSPAAGAVDTGGPQPCQEAASAASAAGIYTADELASAYGFSGLYAAGDLGAGETIAIFELEPFNESDVQAY
ncbi:MAG: protease pro-enzyme activation domain-containing protein, partial [Acidimicrobiales bacterium]